MTLQGESQKGTIINGTDTNQIFIINAGVTVSLQNLTLTNGKAPNGKDGYNSGSGGAIIIPEISTLPM